MFRNKHIIRASFVALFCAIIATIYFYRYFTIKNIVVDSLIKENNKISSNYVDNIWEKFVDSATSIKIKSLGDALENDKFKEFSRESLSFLSSHNRLKISVYNVHSMEFLSTNKYKIAKTTDFDFFEEILYNIDKITFQPKSQSELIAMALKGETKHNINLDAKIDEYNNGGRSVLLESWYPIIDSSQDNYSIDGVISITQDITEEWNKILYFEKRVSVVLIGVFSLFFVIILINTHNAQRIIDQQVANNKFLEEARIQAESKSSATTQFLANISHELRTPLNAIIGFAEVILSEAYGKLQPAQYLEYINDINNSGKHLLSVINDILDYSKASADRLKVDMIEVDTTKVASSSIRFVKPRADDAKVILVEKLPKEHIVILADPKRLKQALLNLLSNAVKFTPENGSVTLELLKNTSTKEVIIRVIDTGIGMEEKDIPKALSSFGQVDNKLSRRYEGTGLGLPLTKKLVELMGGKFEITSKVNHGTTVSLTFKYEEI